MGIMIGLYQIANNPLSNSTVNQNGDRSPSSKGKTCDDKIDALMTVTVRF